MSYETGTLTCKGGTEEQPACDSLDVYAGCLICSGEHSCKDICMFKSDDDYTCYGDLFIQGSVGYNCPPATSPATSPATGSSPKKSSCFSASNFVEVQGKGIVSLASLEVGDYVKTETRHDDQRQFSRVLSFMHVDDSKEVEYIQIYTDVDPAIPLEVSSDHLLYLSNKTALSAQDVRVGDVLRGDKDETIVTRIATVKRHGLYAPATENGLISVSGVTASTYISFLDESIVSPTMQAWLSHATLAPLRMVCGMVSFSICTSERYSDDGYSMNLFHLIDVGFRFLGVTGWMQLLALIVIVPFILILSYVEVIVQQKIWMALYLVPIYFALRNLPPSNRKKLAK
jgi:hypothetical protein